MTLLQIFDLIEVFGYIFCSCPWFYSKGVLGAPRNIAENI